MSSSYFPRSNNLAELAVKTGKHILMDDMSPDGEVNNDRFLRDMLQCSNPPQPDTRWWWWMTSMNLNRSGLW